MYAVAARVSMPNNKGIFSGPSFGVRSAGELSPRYAPDEGDFGRQRGHTAAAATAVLSIKVEHFQRMLSACEDSRQRDEEATAAASRRRPCVRERQITLPLAIK